MTELRMKKLLLCNPPTHQSRVLDVHSCWSERVRGDFVPKRHESIRDLHSAPARRFFPFIFSEPTDIYRSNAFHLTNLGFFIFSADLINFYVREVDGAPNRIKFLSAHTNNLCNVRTNILRSRRNPKPTCTKHAQPVIQTDLGFAGNTVKILLNPSLRLLRWGKRDPVGGQSNI